MDRFEAKHRQIQNALRRMRGDADARLLVVQVMTPSPTCVAPETTVLELVRLFHAQAFRHPLVTDSEGRLLGVVSDRDVLRCFDAEQATTSDALARITAAEVMSADVVTVGPDDSVRHAVGLMRDQGISCLPVVQAGALLGIVTASDLQTTLDALLEEREGLQAARSAALADWRPQD